MCSAPLLELRAKLDDMTTRAPAAIPYEFEKFKADVLNGTVDISAYQKALESKMDPEGTLKKEGMAIYGELVKLQSTKVEPVKLQWDEWAEKLGDDFVAEVKADFEKTLSEVTKTLTAKQAENAAERDALYKKNVAEIEKIAASYKATAEEGKAAVIAQLEAVVDDAENLKEMTIAKILENDPEMRKQIEDDIMNNVWAVKN